MSSAPAITVLTSVHNGERWLRDSLESIRSQTFADFELLVVDDGSRDGTPGILSSFTDPRLRVVVNPENMGLAWSLNRGLREARGEWIARHDADDWSDPRRLEEQLAFARARACDVSFCDYLSIREDGAESAHRVSALPEVVRRWRCLFSNWYGGHPCAFFRRGAVLDLGGYDPAFRQSQDYDLWERCCAAGLRFAHLPRILVRRREHSGSATRQRAASQQESAATVSRRAIGRLRPDLTAEQMDALRWLLRGEWTAPSAVSRRDGLALCRALVASYLARYPEAGAAARIWCEVAESLQWRLRKVPGGDRPQLLGLWLEAALRARGHYRPPVRSAWHWVLGHAGRSGGGGESDA